MYKAIAENNMLWIFPDERLRKNIMEILIFGTGKLYQKYKAVISKDDSVIALLDNNQELWGKKIDGKTVCRPADVSKLHYEKIVLMSNYACEMRKQLMELGCKKDTIIHYTEYIDAQTIGEMNVFLSENVTRSSKGKCLVISTTLGYNGGSLAAVYAACAMKESGFQPVIAAPEGNPLFINEMRRKGISFIIYKNLSHAKQNELGWMQDFRHIVVNTLQMSCCAIEIAKNRRVILWLHEALNFYDVMRYWEDKIKEGIISQNLKIYAVSPIARDNFIKNYSLKEINLLPYGIPKEQINIKRHKSERIIFAIAGYISKQKGQDIFLDAADIINQREAAVDFWIVGKKPENNFGRLIENRVKKLRNVQMIGELSHDKMIQFYNQIDVLVVASREDMLPIVATEAMMLGKVCIVSNISGTADYIQDYRNGFVFQKENPDELAQNMLWCMENFDKLEKIGEQAAVTYEENFSMEIFRNNLEEAINNSL